MTDDQLDLVDTDKLVEALRRRSDAYAISLFFERSEATSSFQYMFGWREGGPGDLGRCLESCVMLQASIMDSIRPRRVD